MEKKQEKLHSLLRQLGSVVVAFSGGVDSTFLAVTAHQVLGVSSLAVTAASPLYPPREVAAAGEIARRFGLRHRLISTAEMDNPRFVANDPQRCYYCKRELFHDLLAIARQEGIAWVADGSNVEDLGDFRPGRRAAQELGVRSPLLEAGLTKPEIRRLSRGLGLPTWDKPAFACLASRLPYGTPVTPRAVEQVNQAEELLLGLGFTQVRVRHYGALARIEVDAEELPRLMEAGLRQRVVAGLRGLGYDYVTLDLEGYCPGSMNRVLAEAPGESRLL